MDPRAVRLLARSCPAAGIGAESGMNAFSNLDRETFQQVLASAFVVQESQIDRKSLSAVRELEQLVARGELDLDGAMYQVAECARNVANATGVAIALLKGGQLIHRAGSGSAASDIGRQVTAALTVSAHVDGTREILRVEDAQTDKRIEASVCRQFRARSLLILPIYQTRTVVGVLEVMFGEPHTFQDAEVLIYQLMARRIEASILQAAPPEEKTIPIAQLPIILDAVPQVPDQAEAFLDDTGSLSALPPDRSVSQRCESTWAAARELPKRNQQFWHPTKIMHHARDVKWPRRGRNLVLAAVSTALVLACWIAYSVRRPVSSLESSAQPTSGAIGPQARSKGAEAISAKSTPAAQPPLASANAAEPARPRVRHVRVGRDEVDYIGEDVTVRHFTYPSAPQRRPAEDSRVVHIGDDVTVRYFTPKPAVRPDGR